jgi:CRP/FNR family transcriptional regulator, nitrogen fixation regulation protein
MARIFFFREMGELPIRKNCQTALARNHSARSWNTAERGKGLIMTLALTSTSATERPSYCETKRHEHEDTNLSALGAHLSDLHPHCVRQRFTRNATIFSEGDHANRVYRVVEGVVRICSHTADGRRHISDFALSGEVFGIAESDSHGFSAETVNEAVLISYPRSTFDSLSRSNQDIGRSLLAHLYENLRVMRHHLLVLGCQDAKERMASFLLRLAERMGVPSGKKLELAMGRQDIADHLGLTIETICRAIRDLKNEGALVIPNSHQIILKDIPALRALAITN